MCPNRPGIFRSEDSLLSRSKEIRTIPARYSFSRGTPHDQTSPVGGAVFPFVHRYGDPYRSRVSCGEFRRHQDLSRLSCGRGRGRPCLGALSMERGRVEAVNLPQGPAGKLGGINDFCIYPDINWIGRLTNVSGQTVDGGCAKCHPGLGEKPDTSPTQAQLENIDCLICHSDSYKRKTGWVDGSLRFVPDTERMSVSLLEAARHITRPTNDSCLNCTPRREGRQLQTRRLVGGVPHRIQGLGRASGVHRSGGRGAFVHGLPCDPGSSHRRPRYRPAASGFGPAGRVHGMSFGRTSPTVGYRQAHRASRLYRVSHTRVRPGNRHRYGPQVGFARSVASVDRPL